MSLRALLQTLETKAKLRLVELEHQAEAHFRLMLQAEQVNLRNQLKAFSLELKLRLTALKSRLLAKLKNQLPPA